MASPAWNFVLTDQAFNPVGEILNAGSRRVTRPLRGLATGSFTVKVDNPLAAQMIDNVGYIKAYRNGVLQVVGPIISADETADKSGLSVAVTFTDAGWFLQKRLVGKSANGTVYATTNGRLWITHQVIDSLNAASDLYMDRQTGLAYTTGALSGDNYVAGPYKTALDVLKELASGAEGFEWYIKPTENYANGVVTGTKIGQLWTTDTSTQTVTLGSPRPNAVFEFGASSNIASYQILTSRDTQANQVFHNASAGPDAPGYPTVSASDAVSTASWGLLEDVAQGDLLDQNLRQQLVNRHVDLRKDPRRVFKFVPVQDLGDGRVPSFGVDYTIGDTVRARVLYHDVTRLDGMLRVYGVSFEIDDKGIEALTLTLTPDDT